VSEYRSNAIIRAFFFAELTRVRIGGSPEPPMSCCVFDRYLGQQTQVIGLQCLG